MDPYFALHVEQDGQGPVVRLRGELDLGSAPQFRECLHELLGQTVVLDFTEVTFMDSTTISVLVTALKRANSAGGELILHGVQPPQMKVLDIVGVSEILNFDGDSAAR